VKPTTPAPVVVASVIDTSVGEVETAVCAPLTACTVEGATCTEGTETCCGETYPALECTCETVPDGSKLAWTCKATDSCLLPCETLAPVATPSTSSPVVVVTNGDEVPTIGSPDPPTTSAPSVAEDELDLSDDSGAESLGSLGVMGSCAFAVIVALVWSF